MKKAIAIACTICLMLAMVSAGSVFAYIDTLTITIENSCTLGSEVAGPGDDAESDSENTPQDEIAVIVKSNQVVTDFGSSVLNTKCNNDKGYTIQATMTDMLGRINLAEDAESNDDSIIYGSSLGAGRWTAFYEDVGIENGSAVVVTSAADDMAEGSEYIINYGVQTKEDQAQGYYTGTVTYELFQNS